MIQCYILFISGQCLEKNNQAQYMASNIWL